MSSSLSQFTIILIWAYNALLFCIPVLVLLGLGFVAVGLLRRHSPNRSRIIKIGVTAIVLAAVMPVTQYALWHGALRNSIEADQTASHAKRKETILAESSVRCVGDQVPSVDSLLGSVFQEGRKPQLVVVNFFATWCGPCLAELPHLQKLADKYRDKHEVLFVVVGREETQETLNAFAKTNGYGLPFIADVDKAFYSEFATSIIPRTYLLNQDREIVFEIVGLDLAAFEHLERMIDQLFE